jgi:hypothetical protein
MSKRPFHAAGVSVSALAAALACPLALCAQQNGVAAPVPTLGPLGLVGLVAGIAGAGLLTMRRNRDKNRKD